MSSPMCRSRGAGQEKKANINECHVVELVLLGDIKSTTDCIDIFHKPKAALQLHKLLWV